MNTGERLQLLDKPVFYDTSRQRPVGREREAGQQRWWERRHAGPETGFGWVTGTRDEPDANRPIRSL